MKLFEVWNIDADYGDPEHFIAFCETKERALELAQEYYEEDYQKEDWEVEEMKIQEYCFALNWIN